MMDLGVTLALTMFVVFLAMILIGYNVAFSFASTALFFSFIGNLLGVFDPNTLNVLPGRWFGAVSDSTLLAVPFFVLMGAILERSGLAERLLDAIGMLLGPLKGGVAAAVVLVGTLLAAATGVVAATVIVMGLLSLPTMIRLGYDHKLATGVIVASGTLAQLVPPSLVLILLAQQMGVGILGLFAGALIPGLMLSAFYAMYALGISYLRPGYGPPMPLEERALTGKVLALEVLFSVVPIILLIIGVLFSIFQGIATPSESGAVGVLGALTLAVLAFWFDKILIRAGATHIDPRWRLTPKAMSEAARSTANISILVMTLLFASSFFSLMFLQLGGSDATADFLAGIGGGKTGFVIVAMIAVFLLGINLEFLEITFIVVPIFLPAMEALGFTIQEKIWFTVMMAVNLNMAFISPPVGFSLFYLQSVAPPEVKTADIHKGALPFMVLQGMALVILAAFPGVVEFSHDLFVAAN
jgi:tripartite ATP-independent transporter DctM subunit